MFIVDPTQVREFLQAKFDKQVKLGFTPLRFVRI